MSITVRELVTKLRYVVDNSGLRQYQSQIEGVARTADVAAKRVATGAQQVAKSVQPAVEVATTAAQKLDSALTKAVAPRRNMMGGVSTLPPIPMPGQPPAATPAPGAARPPASAPIPPVDVQARLHPAPISPGAVPPVQVAASVKPAPIPPAAIPPVQVHATVTPTPGSVSMLGAVLAAPLSFARGAAAEVGAQLAAGAARAAPAFERLLAIMSGMVGRAQAFGAALSSAIGRASSQAGALGGAMNGIMLALAGVSLTRIADEWASIRGRVSLVTDGIDEQKGVMQELFGIANKNRQAMTATSDLFLKAQLNKKELDMSTADVLKLADIAGMATAVGGGTKQQQQASLMQFGQSLGKGKFNDDELKSVIENNQRLAKVIADAAGTSIGKLPEMGSKKLLDVKELMPKILAQFDKLNAEMVKMPRTFGGGTQIMRNHIGRIIDKWNQNSSAARLFERAVEAVVPHLEKIMEFMAVIAGAAIAAQAQAFLKWLWPLRSIALTLAGIFLILDDVNGWLEGAPSLLGDLIGPVKNWRNELNVVRGWWQKISDWMGVSGAKLGSLLAFGAALGAVFWALTLPLRMVFGLISLAAGRGSILSTVFRGVVSIVGGLARLLVTGVGGAVRTVAVAVMAMAAALGWPVTLAILAAIAALIYFGMTWDDVKKRASQFWSWCKDAAGEVGGFLVALWDAVWSGNWTEVQAKGQRFWDWIKSTATDFGAWLVTYLTGAWNAAADAAARTVLRMIDGMKSAFSDVFEWVSNKASALFQWTGKLGNAMGGDGQFAAGMQSLSITPASAINPGRAGPPGSVTGGTINNSTNVTVNAPSGDPAAVGKAAAQAVQEATVPMWQRVLSQEVSAY